MAEDLGFGVIFGCCWRGLRGWKGERGERIGVEVRNGAGRRVVAVAMIFCLGPLRSREPLIGPRCAVFLHFGLDVLDV